MKKEKKYYRTSVICENCMTRKIFEIPFGTTAENFIKGKICKRCGCKIREK